MRVFTGHRFRLNTLVFSPDGRYLAASGADSSVLDRVVQLWDVAGETDPPHMIRERLRDLVHLPHLMFRPHGRQLLLWNGQCWKCLDVGTGQLTHEPELTSLQPRVVSSNGRWAVFRRDAEVSDSIHLSVSRWSENRWDEVWSRKFEAKASDEFGNRLFHAWHLDSSGGHVVVVSTPVDDAFRESGAAWVQVIETATGSDLFHWVGEFPLMASHAFISTSGQLAYLHQRRLRAVNLSVPNGELITRTNSSRKHFTAAAFSPDGKSLATTSNDTTVTMWDTATWQPIRQYGWEIGKLRAVAFAPDGLTCAAGSDTGKVVLFDVDG